MTLWINTYYYFIFYKKSSRNVETAHDVVGEIADPNWWTQLQMQHYNYETFS